MGAEEGGVGGMSGVQVGRECGWGGRGRRGYVWGVVWGASRVCLWVHWGSVWGVVGERLGAAGVWLWVHWGSVWGADLVRMSAPGSFWGLDGTEVLCVRR